MHEYLLNQEQKDLQAQARDVVKSIPRQMILDMDRDKIQFPKEFLQEAGRRNLMGCRYPKEWGGIGYTDVYPVERIVRDLRLASIWTGTNEVMNMIVANEWYKEYWKNKPDCPIRDMEMDAAAAHELEEKIFE